MYNDVIRICAVALICAVGALVLKGINSNVGVAVRLIATIAVFSFIALGTARFFNEVVGAVGAELSAEYATSMLKALGIGLLCGICADICRDCGEGTVASCVETVGNLAILFLCVPLFEELMGYARGLLSIAEK